VPIKNYANSQIKLKNNFLRPKSSATHSLYRSCEKLLRAENSIHQIRDKCYESLPKKEEFKEDKADD
jgi:hypothetical protein